MPTLRYNQQLRVYFFAGMSNQLYRFSCEELNCERGNGCCINQGGLTGINYCAVSSRCKTDPLWQSIVLPAVLFLLAAILLAIACYKISQSKKETMKVHNFARKQIRMESKPSHNRLSTLTSIF